jgi:preprotein translocase subunit SecF
MAKHGKDIEDDVQDAAVQDNEVQDKQDVQDAVEVDDAADDLATTAVELTAPASGGPQHGFFVRLYTGTGAFDVVGKRKLWFGISGLIVLVALASILLRGFTFGIDFEGGTKMSMPVDGANGRVTTQQVEDVFSQTIGKAPESVVVVGNGATATVQIRAETLSNPDTEKLRNALFDKFQPKDSEGKPSKQVISDSAVSETWGGQITKKALIALAVFLVLVSVYIAVRYELYMAIAALAALVFDLLITAGVYSVVGFEVTPATVIGLLTILGFSLYDTVIVFDKVEENVHGFEHTTRRTFAEQANLAINQTFMRSINTSLISVLPIISLIVVAVWMLGVGTLKDLALVQLVGVIVGTYSSIFFATPLLVSLRERTELVRSHTRRVENRRRGAAAKTGGEVGTSEAAEPDTVGASVATAVIAPDKPAPGAKPIRPTGRPSGKRSPRR